MCGISGVFAKNLETARAAVERMNNRLAHRGPDDHGLASISIGERHLILGHRRLSILDLSSAGHQPMEDSGSGNQIVFNGEIYNFRELRKELAGLGHTFVSNGDTEVVLKAYAQWGTDCLKRLHGMFALALYEQANRRLLLARDPMGIKPLYLHCSRSCLLFSSEFKAMAQSGLIAPAIDRRALATLLAYGAVQEPVTMYKEIASVAPGTYVQFALQAATEPKAETRTYWRFPVPQDPPERENAVLAVRALLQNGVSNHLISDVPVAVLLSRGLDSNAIAALSAAASQAPISSFTVTLLDHPSMDEGNVAQHLAARYGVKHHPICLSEEQVRNQVLRFLKDIDQPTVDGLNVYVVAKAIRDQGFKVALSGTGGDEIFGGYSTSWEVPKLVRSAHWLNRIPVSLRVLASNALFIGRSARQRIKAREMAATLISVDHLYFRRRRLFSDAELAAFGLRAEDLGLNSDYVPPEARQQDCLVDGHLETSVANLESRFYLANMLLRDSDVFGMAHGLEIRVPMLDLPTVQFVSQLPGAWRTRKDGVSKPLLSEAISDIVPAEIRGLPKRGFELPIDNWIQGPLSEPFSALIRSAARAGILESNAVGECWRKFQANPAGMGWQRCWLLGVLGSWFERHQADGVSATKG